MSDPIQDDRSDNPKQDDSKQDDSKQDDSKQDKDAPASASPQSRPPLDAAMARVKVVDPLATVGPSSPAQILGVSDNGLILEIHKEVLPGSMVHVRTRDKIVFGRVLRCVPSGSEFEVAVEIVETF